MHYSAPTISRYSRSYTAASPGGVRKMRQSAANRSQTENR
ncbi:hypothetical protein B7759_01158 [Burkholderia glumae]|nr:hypothetical protein B7759_01158 [Burkholderia glumae]